MLIPYYKPPKRLTPLFFFSQAPAEVEHSC
nr:MAG TPA: hypothetical protein [Caudoviricetes sp.]